MYPVILVSHTRVQRDTFPRTGSVSAPLSHAQHGTSEASEIMLRSVTAEKRGASCVSGTRTHSASTAPKATTRSSRRSSWMTGQPKMGVCKGEMQ